MPQVGKTIVPSYDSPVYGAEKVSVSRRCEALAEGVRHCEALAEGDPLAQLRFALFKRSAL